MIPIQAPRIVPLTLVVPVCTLTRHRMVDDPILLLPQFPILLPHHRLANDPVYLLSRVLPLPLTLPHQDGPEEYFPHRLLRLATWSPLLPRQRQAYK